jgi:hypothetical protein
MGRRRVPPAMQMLFEPLPNNERITMNTRNKNPRHERDRAGKIKYGLAAWLLGLPLPIIILALFWGGCDF